MFSKAFFPWSLKISGLCFTGFMILYNSFPNDKILDSSKLKAFADDKINMDENLKFGLGRDKNFMRNGENACNQHFLLFQVFSKVLCFRVVKSRDCVVKR